MQVVVQNIKGKTAEIKPYGLLMIPQNNELWFSRTGDDSPPSSEGDYEGRDLFTFEGSVWVEVAQFSETGDPGFVRSAVHLFENGRVNTKDICPFIHSANEYAIPPDIHIFAAQPGTKITYDSELLTLSAERSGNFDTVNPAET